MKKSKISKVSLKDQIREVLFEKIISGEFEPGERLKIIPIAESLGVSQAPVREAIQCLVTSGYLELIPNAGARVKEFTEQELKEIIELRKSIELGSLLSKNFDGEAAASVMEKHLKKMRIDAKNEDPANYAINDAAYHRALVEHSGNDKMLSTWDSLLVPKQVSSIIKNNNIDFVNGIAFHHTIIESIRNNEIESACKTLLDHYDFLFK